MAGNMEDVQYPELPKVSMVPLRRGNRSGSGGVSTLMPNKAGMLFRILQQEQVILVHQHGT